MRCKVVLLMRCKLVYAAEHDAGSEDYDGRKGGAAAKAMAAGNRAEDEVGKNEKKGCSRTSLLVNLGLRCSNEKTLSRK